MTATKTPDVKTIDGTKYELLTPTFVEASRAHSWAHHVARTSQLRCRVEHHPERRADRPWSIYREVPAKPKDET